MTEQDLELKPLSAKEQKFINEYLKSFNASEAYLITHPKSKLESAYANSSRLIRTDKIKSHIQARLREIHMTADEAIKLQSEIARGNLGDFITPMGGLDVDKVRTIDGRLVKKFKQRTTIISGEKEDKEITDTEIQLYPADVAQERILRLLGKLGNDNESGGNSVSATQNFSLPAELIAPSFLDVYRDIISGNSNEYAMEGGRGSTKSSFVALAIIYLLIRNPNMHALAMRQVYNTTKDSVFARLEWAINILGLSDSFKFSTSPFEIQYIPTGQKIYFRGADDPAKIKSITPKFGYIGILWFEEFDQFRGEAQVRNIVQSVLRGGDEAYRFETWNTPRTIGHWLNKYVAVPKDRRYHHKSDYRSVPKEWLGKIFLDEAEHLQSVNPSAYEHEYLGIANGIGGMVFENVEVREITDDEIKQFDRIYHGLDFGYYPDPAHYSQVYFDKARLTLYVFGELREYKKRNEDFYKLMIEYGYRNQDLLIADSAEPKSVMDFRAFGANCRGAEKGAGSVEYRIKWLQSLVKIVVDPKRCPATVQELLEYEYEKTKDGEILSEYPDKNNHAIDSVGYGTNVLWMKAGQ